MRPTVLLHVFALFALAVFTSVAASPTVNEAVAARNASPIEARAPVPSTRLDARSPNAPRLRKRKQLVLTEEERISQYLCPQPMRACPISPESQPTTVEQWIQEGFECVDDHEDLTSCGGCGMTNAKFDCTAIEGALGVSCVVGGCRVDSCARGYTRSRNGKYCVRTY